MKRRRIMVIIDLPNHLRTLATRTLMIAGGHFPSGPTYRGRILFRTARGMQLHFNLLDHPALLLGSYERHVVRAMREHIRPGAVVYDVGANIGYLTLVAARFARNGQVVAFEPDPVNRTLLEDNLRMNGIAASIDPRVVGSVPGLSSFATYGYSLVNHAVTTEFPAAVDATILNLPAVSLDGYVYQEGHEPPDFVKIDVEGGEVEVLAGAAQLLMGERPIIVVECRADTWSRIQTIAGRANYSWHILNECSHSAYGQPFDVLLLPRS